MPVIKFTRVFLVTFAVLAVIGLIIFFSGWTPDNSEILVYMILLAAIFSFLSGLLLVVRPNKTSEERNLALLAILIPLAVIIIVAGFFAVWLSDSRGFF